MVEEKKKGRKKMKQFMEQYGDYVITAVAVLMLIGIVTVFGKGESSFMATQFKNLLNTFMSQVNIGGVTP